MDEVYTCICGSQSWSIYDGFIRCVKCQRRYKLERFKALSDAEAFVLELPKDFNKRVEQVKKDIADDSKTEGGR